VDHAITGGSTPGLIADQYPIPHLQDFMQTLARKQVFSTLDLIKAYNQNPFNEKDIPKTAITTPFGMFEYLYMPFGLRNATQTFQRFINEVNQGLDFCYAYINDILIASESVDDHKKRVKEVLAQLQKYGVKINLAKCILGARKVRFLGYEVSGEGSQPPEEKVEAIRDFSRPETIKQLR